MTAPYKAIIKGIRCEIAWDESRENILLVNGEAHEVGSMNVTLDVLRKRRITHIHELAFAQPTVSTPKGMWLLDGKYVGSVELEMRGGREN